MFRKSILRWKFDIAKVAGDWTDVCRFLMLFLMLVYARFVLMLSWTHFLVLFSITPRFGYSQNGEIGGVNDSVGYTAVPAMYVARHVDSR